MFIIFLEQGVFATREFYKDDALLMYQGELMTAEEAAAKECNEKDGSFQFFFKVNSENLCIDATNSKCLARYVNDSPSRYSNCKMVLKRII